MITREDLANKKIDKLESIEQAKEMASNKKQECEEQKEGD